MRGILGILSLAVGFALGGCSDEADPIKVPASSAKVRPTIYVVDQDVTTKYDPNDLGSTYWKNGDEVGILLLDNASHALYTDTKGHIRYRWDGSYWSTEQGYSMTENYVDVYCFYPYPTSLSATPDGLWTESWLPVETGSNTDYLWGTMIDYFKNKVNGSNPDVSMVMYHALARVSFRVKRVIAYDANSTIGRGNVSSFMVTTKQSSNNKSMRGSFKYSLTNGKVDISSMAYDNAAVSFTSIAGHSLPQAVGSTVGETTEFISIVPTTGVLTAQLAIDGQNYTVTLDPYTFKAGYHYVVNLEYTGTQVLFPSATGATGTKMEITPWSSAGTIGTKQHY